MVENKNFNAGHIKNLSLVLKTQLQHNFYICIGAIINNKLVLQLLTDDANKDLNIWAKTHLNNAINGQGGGQKNQISITTTHTNSFNIVKQLFDEWIKI